MTGLIDLGGGLSLKGLALGDEQAIYEAILSDQERLSQFLPFVESTIREGISFTCAYVASVVEPPGNQHSQVFVILSDGLFAGIIGVFGVDWDNGKAEFGYWLLGAFEGKGLVSRSARCLIHRAFHNLGLNRIQVRVAVGNERSLHVAKRLGFTLEGTERDAERFLDGHYVDAWVFSLLAREWRGFDSVEEG